MTRPGALSDSAEGSTQYRPGTNEAFDRTVPRRDDGKCSDRGECGCLIA